MRYCNIAILVLCNAIWKRWHCFCHWSHHGVGLFKHVSDIGTLSSSLDKMCIFLFHCWCLVFEKQMSLLEDIKALSSFTFMPMFVCGLSEAWSSTEGNLNSRASLLSALLLSALQLYNQLPLLCQLYCFTTVQLSATNLCYYQRYKSTMSWESENDLLRNLKWLLQA